MLPAKNKEDRCKKEGRAAADRTGSAGGRWAARPSPGGAAEAGEQPGQRGAQPGEAGTPHPGRGPGSRAVLTSGSRDTAHISRCNLVFLPLMLQPCVKYSHEFLISFNRYIRPYETGYYN